MIVADTGAIIALVDADDRHHLAVRSIYRSDPGAWVLPWAILPEVDYLLGAHVSARAQSAFVKDVASGAFVVERLRAGAIATVDLRDFAPLKLAGAPKLYPRDFGDAKNKLARVRRVSAE